ncbi:protein COFACTOR ASSEMBLY OF COMPLEX C SUBUNIT B CCB3, chloroplastic [Punica granatum]|uniref:Protein COFACTOR ASSEMBLY OF COMPLEX C SUBUNIT B CCB3, chloroplastic n=1 Tax=Punica granatum TaxID=22663 RepID=A0A6P8CLS0_PUNGR|nr:protein COFACTOR ASSEMBLY OF COMPLEX C SUBUNIT B CCB3, chloroplastic [Punica granatum]
MAAMTASASFSPLHPCNSAGWNPLLNPPLKTNASTTSFKRLDRRKPGRSLQPARCSMIHAGFTGSCNELSLQSLTTSLDPPDATNIVQNLGTDFHLIQRLAVADIDPATAKLAIGILGPFLSAFAFLFILRIVMSWYPKLPVGKFPYVIAYAPTEPLLIPTRKLIPPLGGVDVTPVVWFGLISFLNEILVGPQGLLVLLSQQISS